MPFPSQPMFSREDKVIRNLPALVRYILLLPEFRGRKMGVEINSSLDFPKFKIKVLFENAKIHKNKIQFISQRNFYQNSLMIFRPYGEHFRN